jgi:glucose-6-phosphate-specific signal transduction histidine kinase
MTERPPAAIYLIPAAMMLVALLNLPYGYYQLLRVVTLVAAGWIAVGAWQGNRQAWAIAFGLLALLYNPIAPIHFERETWRILNVAGAALLTAGWWRLARPG